jgi:pimeloyl-ACP methyl ester carboxylesterase
MLIDVNGFQMYLDQRGDGEPLLLLHGGTGIGADWRLVFTAGDPAGFRLIVPDLRGHGRSTNPSRAFTFRQAAADVLALLDHLGIARAKAIGLSMGAKTLLRMATQQPDRIDAMVLVSATPYFPAAAAPLAQVTTDPSPRPNGPRTASATCRRRSDPPAVRSDARAQGPPTTWRSPRRCSRSPRAP